MTEVDRIYMEHWRKATPAERFARGVALFDEVRAMLAHQVRREEPHRNERQVKVRVAQKMYADDPRAQALLARLAADVGLE